MSEKIGQRKQIQELNEKECHRQKKIRQDGVKKREQKRWEWGSNRKYKKNRSRIIFSFLYAILRCLCQDSAFSFMKPSLIKTQGPISAT